MHAAQAGDRQAYSELLREVTPFIRALLRRHCSHREDIEEMVQDTLLTLHRVRRTYDPRRPFSPWLGAIAARRGIDGLRRRLRVARHEISADAHSYETFSEPLANDDIEALRARDEIGDELSVGDYVLSGGEVAAMALGPHRGAASPPFNPNPTCSNATFGR